MEKKSNIQKFNNFKLFTSIIAISGLKGYGLQVFETAEGKLCFLAAKQKSEKTAKENANFHWSSKENSLRFTLKNSEIGDVLNMLYFAKDKNYLKKVLQDGPLKIELKHISSTDPKEITFELSLYNNSPQLSIVISRKVANAKLMIPIRLKGGEMKTFEKILEAFLEKTITQPCFIPSGIFCSSPEIDRVTALPKMSIGEKIKTNIMENGNKVDITLTIKDIMFNTSKNILIYVCEHKKKGSEKN